MARLDRSRPGLCEDSPTRSRRRASSPGRCRRSSTERSTGSQSGPGSRRDRGPRRPRVAQLCPAHRRLPGRPGVARQRARAQRRDSGRGSHPRPPQHDRRAASPTTATASRCQPRGGEGCPARPARSRRDRRARSSARRHVPDRQPARRADDTAILAAALGAVALMSEGGGLAPSPSSSAPPRAEEFQAPPPVGCAQRTSSRSQPYLAVHQEDAASRPNLRLHL